MSGSSAVSRPAAGPVSAAVPLTGVQPGRCARVWSIEAPEDDAEHLKVLGICAGRRVWLLRTGDPVIVCVWGTRIGVSRRLADRVMVQPCDSWTAQGCKKHSPSASTPR